MQKQTNTYFKSYLRDERIELVKEERDRKRMLFNMMKGGDENS